MPVEIAGLVPLIQIFDLPASPAFYRDKLDFKSNGDSGQGNESSWEMLKLNDAIIHFSLCIVN